MSTILEEIESKIEELKTSTTKSNVGVVRETGDGVARIEGLSDVMLNEMIEFPNGVYGLALNLEETEVGAILMGDNTLVSEGDEAKTTGRLLSVPVGKALLGRVVNTLGQPLDDKGPIKTETFYPLETIAPGVIKRRSVNQPVQTGLMAIDAMIPIGRGQRELIIGDRATGKTTIAIDTIISQARLNKAAEDQGDKNYRPLYCIYVAIGQKNANVARSRYSKKKAPCHTRRSFRHRLRIPPRTNTWRHLLAPRWVSGSWIMEWMRSLSTTICRSTQWLIGRFRSC
jgi:F-type H+-transporting ATPase subunit alpha